MRFLVHVVFSNTKHLPFDVYDSDLYEPRSLSFNEIFSDILKITSVLDDKNVNGFIKWCPKRRMNEAGQKIVTRLLYIFKNKFVCKSYFFNYIHVYNIKHMC